MPREIASRVVARGDHVLALVADRDRGAGVLAAGQHAAGGDVGVLEQLERDELVVGRRLGVVEDRAELLEVARAQEVRDVVDRGAGEERQRLGLDREHVALAQPLECDVVAGELAVLGARRARAGRSARSGSRSYGSESLAQVARSHPDAVNRRRGGPPPDRRTPTPPPRRGEAVAAGNDHAEVPAQWIGAEVRRQRIHPQPLPAAERERPRQVARRRDQPDPGPAALLDQRA